MTLADGSGAVEIARCPRRTAGPPPHCRGSPATAHALQRVCGDRDPALHGEGHHGRVGTSGQQHRRTGRYAARSLTAALLTAALLTGCTADDGTAPGADPGPTPGTTAAADGAQAAPARPTFEGRAVVALAPGEEVFVSPSCTPNLDGQRLCWNESADPYRRDDEPRPVTVTAAAAEPTADGLAWAVRLTLDGPSARTAADVLERAVNGAVDLLLTEADGDVLLPVATADVEAVRGGRELLLAGVDKPAAYSLVERLRTT